MLTLERPAAARLATRPVRAVPVATPWTHTVLPYRACELCTHGAMQAGQRVCTSPPVVAPARSRPVELARRATGGCGPEAMFLDFPGLSG